MGADDLKFLTDEHESMAFRRRGYERDALLQAVVERSGYLELIREEEEQQGGQKRLLAALPHELSHFDLEQYRDRPVQGEVAELLVTPKTDRSFTSCVLLHGMGGTGKTMTAVAVLQDTSVRAFFSDIYWLTVGADAVGEKITQLQGTFHRQLTGKVASSDEEKSAQEWQQALVAAMAGKTRALVVLDDPWTPEQTRLLNPIDGSSAEHRLLVTSRIRDLLPKATRVELPLMGKDEAVALLLDLASIDEKSYFAEQPDSAWPPDAAYEIAAECGLLPITLIIAAQVMRSWGSGWGTYV